MWLTMRFTLCSLDEIREAAHKDMPVAAVQGSLSQSAVHKCTAPDFSQMLKLSRNFHSEDREVAVHGHNTSLPALPETADIQT